MGRAAVYAGHSGPHHLTETTMPDQFDLDVVAALADRIECSLYEAEEQLRAVFAQQEDEEGGG